MGGFSLGWENTTNVTNLFEGLDVSNGFTIKKTITYNNLKNILKKLSEYTKLTHLVNLFSYCTVTDYNNEEINFGKDESDNEDIVLNNIINISNLF